MTSARMTASLDALPACPAFFPQEALARRVPWPDAHAHAPLNPDAQTLRSASHAPLAAELRESDLPAILARFAEVAGNRYNYLNKKPAKTEAKMYHGTGRAAR